MRYDIVCLLSHAEAILWRWAVEYDKKHDYRIECRKNMLCECQRRTCLGRTINVRSYVRGIMES